MREKKETFFWAIFWVSVLLILFRLLENFKFLFGSGSVGSKGKESSGNDKNLADATKEFPEIKEVKIEPTNSEYEKLLLELNGKGRLFISELPILIFEKNLFVGEKQFPLPKMDFQKDYILKNIWPILMNFKGKEDVKFLILRSDKAKIGTNSIISNILENDKISHFLNSIIVSRDEELVKNNKDEYLISPDEIKEPIRSYFLEKEKIENET